MENKITSNRLTLSVLEMSDAEFIYEIVNTPDWIRFIGDRNVKTKKDAEVFVQRIINNPNVNYWVVRIQRQLVPIGIVSFVKRDYLEFYDVGFAFLPKHTKQGYAFEATTAFLKNLVKDYSAPKILATTIKENSNSIRLLKKLSFQFEKQIAVENEELYLYSISTDNILI